MIFDVLGKQIPLKNTQNQDVLIFHYDVKYGWFTDNINYFSTLLIIAVIQYSKHNLKIHF